MLKKIKKVACQFLCGLAIPIIIVSILTTVWLAFPHAKAESNEKVYYYLHDHLGGIEAITDEDGKIVERRDYLPYGNKRMTTGKTDENYGFTGKELDEETNLYYYGTRYYDPTTARFTQIDPLVLGESSKPLTSVLENPQALNGYSYVLNNPLRYVDEEGEYQIDVHFDLTLYLGKMAGFTDSDALNIAYYDQYTDINKDTSPWNKENGWKHFANRDVAESWVNNAINDKSISKFGNAIHYYQDTYSHYANGYKFNEGGHVLDSILSIFGQAKNPDKTYNNVPQANKMAKGTFYFMRSYIKSVYGTGDLKENEYDANSDTIWNEIKNEVETFNSSSDEMKDAIYPKSDYENFIRSFIDNE